VTLKNLIAGRPIETERLLSITIEVVDVLDAGDGKGITAHEIIVGYE
jgi:hypothetical protein